MTEIEEPARYDVPLIGGAVVACILREMERVYWNTNQKSQAFGANDGFRYHFGDKMYYSSYNWNEYYEDGPLPDNEVVNLAFGKVRIYWYKYFPRGLESNLEMTTQEWSDWLEEAISYLQSQDTSI